MADSIVQSFGFENRNVRTIQKDDGSVWFCLGDSLSAMGTKTVITDAKASIEEHLGEGLVINLPLQTIGGEQDTLFCSESALTFLLSRSRTELGKKLNRYIHREVLPNIRKTGGYQASTQVPRQLPIYTSIEYLDASERVEKVNNEVLKQLLRNQLVEELSVIQGNKMLPAAEQKEYTIVKQRARELGISNERIGNGGGLGKHVRKYIQPAFNERIGDFNTNRYEVNDRLDEVILAYFR